MGKGRGKCPERPGLGPREPQGSQPVRKHSLGVGGEGGGAGRRNGRAAKLLLFFPVRRLERTWVSLRAGKGSVGTRWD